MAGCGNFSLTIRQSTNIIKLIVPNFLKNMYTCTVLCLSSTSMLINNRPPPNKDYGEFMKFFVKMFKYFFPYNRCKHSKAYNIL